MLRFALVGCGAIGKRHVAVLDAEPKAQLVSICDTDDDKLIDLTYKYPYVTGYKNLEDMLAADDFDILVVATPHNLHSVMAIQGLKQGYDVLIEKPMALSTTQCRDILQVAQEMNQRCWVVKQNRFNKPVLYTKNILDEQALGTIRMVKCDVLWNRPQAYYAQSSWRGTVVGERGALYTQVSHFIDLLVWWFGDVREAHGYIQKAGHDIQIEDNGAAQMLFENDVLGSLTWTTCVYNQNFEGSITIIGESGTIKIGGKYLNEMDHFNVEGHPLPSNISFDDEPNSYGKYQGTSSNHPQVYKALIEHLENGSEPIVEGVEGIRSIDAIEKIYRSVDFRNP